MSVTEPADRTRPARTQALSSATDLSGSPTAPQRLRAPLPGDTARGWLVAGGLGLLALVLRLWSLGTPHKFAFDETYYAKDAWSLWRHGYAQNWVEDADEAILDGRFASELQTGDPTMVVHPELGKWLIGLGEQVFGFDPFGWRVASAVVGALMVVVMVRLARRLTRSTLLGAAAGLLLCFDGLHFVLSRLALLDIFVAFFLLSAVSLLVVDRDWTRVRMTDLAPTHPATGWGPVRGLWWRPWRLAAGVMFGLAVSCKWSALIPLAGFGLLVVLWDAGARRSLGVRWSMVRAAVVDGIPAFGYLVLVALAVYVATWSGWLVNADVYEASLASNQYGDYWGDYTLEDPAGFVSSFTHGLRSLALYHRDVFAFHSSGLLEATHSYQSHPASWPVMHRPVVVATELDIPPGSQGCAAAPDSTCLREVLLLGTPLLWWGGLVALLHTAYAWVTRRDWRHGLVLVGVLTTWLPFFRYADRPMFSFYAITLLPFTILAITLLLGHLIGPEQPTRRRLLGTSVAGAFVALVVVHFAWLWPVYTFGLVTTAEWLDRIWFTSWI